MVCYTVIMSAMHCVDTVKGPLQNSYQSTFTLFLGVYWVPFTSLSGTLVCYKSQII